MIRGLLFDKDGTLLDMEATWGAWAVGALRRLAGGDRARARAMGEAIGIDAQTGAFDPEGPAVAGTLGEQAVLMSPIIDRAPAEIEDWLRAEARHAVPSLIAGPELFEALRPRVLGVATNDGEAAARAQLERAGLGGTFGFVAGYDSGHGAKPGPGMVLAFAEWSGLAPAEIAMIGDSEHDLHAARAAGAVAVAVLTGPIGRERLAPHADVVLPDVTALTDWLGAKAT